jgi:hypothetical protein
MQLKDESILAIGMISIALGTLIGHFLHFEYSGFSITDFGEGVLVGRARNKNIDKKTMFHHVLLPGPRSCIGNVLT